MDSESSGEVPALAFRVLGPLEVVRSGARIALGGTQQRAVLALLVLEAGRVVTMGQIADALWDGRPRHGSVSTIQTYIFHLREGLEPTRTSGRPGTVLVRESGGYRLHVDPNTVDATAFEQRVRSGRDRLDARDYAEASAQLSEALAMWRGDVLADLADFSFVAAVAARLDELRLAALEARIDADLALGHHWLLVPELDTLVAAHPLRERLHEQRMLALYRSGRQADALAAYRDLRKELRDELGIEPSEPVQQLHRSMGAQDPPLALPPAASPAAARDEVIGPGSQHAATPQVPPVPASRTRRPARRWPWLVAAGAVAAAIVAAGVAIVANHTSQSSLRSLPPNSIGIVAPDGSLHDTIPVGQNPEGIAYGDGSLWVTNSGDSTVMRVDPKEKRVIQTIPVGENPVAVAVYEHNVWVVNSGDATVTQINTTTNATVGKAISVGNLPMAIAAGPAGVWVANTGEDTIQRIDPSTGSVSTPISVGDGPDGLALDGTSLWVAYGQGSSVERLDVHDGHPLGGSVLVGAGAKAITATSDGVWVANQAGLSVTHLSASDDRVAATVAVGDGPSAVVAVKNQLWVSDEYDGTISQLDRGTNRVLHRYSVGGSPHALALAGSDVWVTSDAFAGGRHIGGTLVIESTPLSGDYTELDPANVYTPPGGSAERPVYDGLVAFRAEGGIAGGVSLVPDLAADLPNPTDHGRTYTFAMRPGIRYSTGETVHASDVLRGLRRELTLGRTGGSPDLFFDILGAEECSQKPTSCDTELKRGVEVDDRAGLITFHLKQSDGSFLYKLTFFVMAVAPRPDTEAKTTPLPATGPYQISQYVPGKSLVLTRNPYFKQWSFAAQPAGYPDEIVFRTASSATTAVNDVLAGRADLIWSHELDAPQIGPLARTYPEQFRSVASFGLGYLTLNTTVPPLNDRRVRRAIAEAVDRRVIAGFFGGDSAANPTCQILPRGFPGYRPYCPYADTDFAPRLAEARSLVAASGAAGATIDVYTWQDLPAAPQLTAYLVDVLHNLGFKTTTRMTAGQPSFLDAIRAARGHAVLGAATFWTADYSEPSTFFDQLFTCGSIRATVNYNLSFYCNSMTDKAIAGAEASEITDQAAASNAWAAVDREVTSDAPVVPLVQGVFSWFISTRLGNFQATPLASVLYSQMWVR